MIGGNEFLELERKVYPKINKEIRRRVLRNNTNYEFASNFINRRTFYLRPTLIILATCLFGGQENDALLPSVALQLSNEWMLIHDDIEDQSDFRRRGLALHKIYGEELALNCGDYLHMEAWRALSDYIINTDIKKGKQVYEKFYDIINTTINAQTIDLNFSYKLRDFNKINEEEYYNIAQGKGAYYSVYGPLQLGAIIANQNVKILSVLQKMGKPAGIAAQIQNDILDIKEGETSDRGYQDIHDGKLTLISLYIFNKANKIEKNKIRTIYLKDREARSEVDIEFILSLIKKYDGLKYAEKKRDEFGRIADNAFIKYKKYFPDNYFRQVLGTAITSQYKTYQHT